MRRLIAAMAAMVMLAAPASAQTKGEFAKPEALGLSSDRLGRLDAAMLADVDAKRKAGMVVLVARHGKIAHLKAAGMSDIERNRPMTTDALFRLHSQSKPMVSVGLLMLYEQGRFALNDPVELYIPSFARLKVAEVGADGQISLRAPRRKPTILDMFRHTGGFPTTAALTFWGGPVEKIWIAAEGKFKGDLASQVDALADLPLLDDPGREWRYGPEHDVQARLIEIFSGMRLDDYMRERIFRPLALKDTDYTLTPQQMTRYTTIYGPDGKGGLAAVDKPEDSWYLRDAKIAPTGSSHISSTAYDQFRFGQMLLNGGELDGVRLLSRKTVDMMLSDQLPRDAGPMRLVPGGGAYDNLRYGLGIGVVGDTVGIGRPTSLGAAGWSGSSTTNMVIDRKEGMIIVALTQYRPGDRLWMQRVEALAFQALVDAPSVP